MKSTFSTAGSLGLMSVLAVAASLASAQAAEKRVTMLKPNAGVSFDIGNSHAMTYFVGEKGVCNLTMVMAEIVAGDEVPASAGTRFNVSIEGGKHARIDTAEGKSVEFTCAPGATMVNLRKLDAVAYTVPGRN